ncbi:DUF6282 family protein [Paenibacillus validus]|uniref:PHP domain-containing protein n=1 Tax=Paenibacillus validus TaxID=44253 RepID=A0A7X2ZC43_9BACL|nr:MULTISPECIES: DUF6282 family protein [Paenibacillus]MED4602773.1 DUF6282 family protein [Paenibacillus validus]MED4605039.1 DUF6282 family protein [Paenibacillus validus]MUG72240.1 hypothetical protein [Paenibacillus validus]
MNHLKGAIDIHVHSSPSIFPRSVNDLELAEQAKKAGMRAIVLKAHEESTVSRAKLVSKVIDGIEVYGSLVLNEYVGGLNPYAVDMAIQQGAKLIWMPTGSAKHHLEHYGGKSDYKEMKSTIRLLPQKGITVLAEDGRLLPVVYDIIDLIKGSGAVLATGHLSPLETRIVVEAAVSRGVEKVLVAHPDLKINKMDLSLQIELVKMGAYVEKSMLTLMPLWKSIEPDELVQGIRQIGLDKCILQTDFGQANHPTPTEGYNHFIQILLEHGLTEKEVEQMACSNPAELIGLT